MNVLIGVVVFLVYLAVGIRIYKFIRIKWLEDDDYVDGLPCAVVMLWPLLLAAFIIGFPIYKFTQLVWGKE